MIPDAGHDFDTHRYWSPSGTCFTTLSAPCLLKESRDLSVRDLIETKALDQSEFEERSGEFVIEPAEDDGLAQEFGESPRLSMILSVAAYQMPPSIKKGG